MSFLSPEYQSHVNAPDHEHILFQLDLANRFSHEVPGCIDLTRLQRASKGAGQSTRGSSDNVIERGGARLGNCRRNLVMLRHRAGNALRHRSGDPDNAQSILRACS